MPGTYAASQIEKSMTDDRQDKFPTDRDDTLAAVLKLAGPSPVIDKAIEDRVYANVRHEWNSSKPLSRPLRWAVPLAMAATVLVAIGLIDSSNKTPAPSAIGTVSVTSSVAENSGYAIGDEVYAGDVLHTSNLGGISLMLAKDISLRIDTNTLLRVDAGNEFTLLNGRIYVDTGDRIYANQHLMIHTASGTATDVGTQFSVQFEDADMSVAVREGLVNIKEGSQTYSAGRGDLVTVRPGTGAQFGSIDITGPEWNWATALAPEFDIENSSLLEFLRWVERETGMELKIDSEAIRVETRRSRLHGSIAGMAPLDALEAVLATTKFTYSVDGGSIVILK